MKCSRTKEKQAEKKVIVLVKETPEWKGFMGNAPGIGELTAALLISKIRIDIADTVSSLWKYMGFVPSSKDPSKREENPGKARAFKAPLYAALGIFLIRKDNPYRFDYDKMKARGLHHGQAINRVTKLWLSHLWATWREWAELPTVVSYANNHLGHENIIKAIDRGWSHPD
jgi:hypothetical protein